MSVRAKATSIAIAGVLFAGATVPAVAQANSLTYQQASAIVSLLQSFGADQLAIARVATILGVPGFTPGFIPSSPVLTASQTVGPAPLPVAFTYNDAIQGHSYIIDYGDGSASPFAQDYSSYRATHLYSTPGVYTARVFPGCHPPTANCPLLNSITITVAGVVPVRNPVNGLIYPQPVFVPNQNY